MYGIECAKIDFKEIVADRNFAAEENTCFKKYKSTNKKICQGIGVGENGE